MHRHLQTPEQRYRSRKDAGLKHKYGISLVDYEERLETQGGVCAICAGPARSDRALDVDHDHVTGEVRGLLCGSCNLGVSYFRDRPDLLIAAAGYLR